MGDIGKRNKILSDMWQRNEVEKEDSDAAFFYSLMYTGELTTKLICSGLLAGVGDDSKKARYTQAYSLVRADGIGDWSKSIEEMLTGPTSHLLSLHLNKERNQLTQKFRTGNWQHDALTAINECLKIIGENVDEIPIKVPLKNWFPLFSRLRNKTRGHGALPTYLLSRICPLLEQSLLLIHNNFHLFEHDWAYLSQNLSGKYNVKSISVNTASFNFLKSNEGKNENLSHGIYYYLEKPIYVELIKSDPDLSDFFFPNGSFNSKRYEVLSYSSGNRDSKDSAKYLMPPGDLPGSETEGRKSLEVIGNVFTNLPKVDSIYINRDNLERELEEILYNERHPMVTLLGRGGIGKTSLALKVLTRMCEGHRFQTILWFSARDIDLLEYGAKSVQPQILDIEDIAKEFVKLINPEKLEEKKFNARAFIEEGLKDQINGISPILAVFDNFETVKNPAEMFIWLDTYIRPPNKILITSRIREFKADYPIVVSGMNEKEFQELVETVSNKLGIRTLVNKSYRDKLFEESGGHPYVAKILLGVVAKKGKAGDINRIVASEDELLTALFERTYNSLSTAAKKVFLTLASWRSTIPKIGLEAVLKTTTDTKIDVEGAVEELNRFSFIDIYSSKKDDSEFISLPLSSFLFGQNKLSVSTFKHQVLRDRDILIMFGVGKVLEIDEGIGTRLERFFRNVAVKIYSQEKGGIKQYRTMLEYVCRRHYQAWLTYASLMEELKNYQAAILGCQYFLQKEMDSNKKISVWKKLAGLYQKESNYFGEIHSLIEMCEIESTSDAAVSSCATRMNQLLSDGRLNENDEEKKAIVDRMVHIMTLRLEKNQENLDDRTKLAWLYVHVGKIKNARKLIEKIQEKDPAHIYAAKLAGKIGKNV